MFDIFTIDDFDDILIGGIDTTDYPDFCDAYIKSAVWKMTGVQLTIRELDQMQEHFCDYASEHAFEQIVENSGY